jgi:cytochrome b561
VGYTRTAIVLHWLVAISVLSLLTVGLYMTGLKISPVKLQIYMLHKSFGLLVLALMLVRVLWRMTHRPPPLPNSMPSWQKMASGVSHALMYLLLLAMPISGWLMNSASGFPTKLFSVLPLPQLIARDSDAFTRWQSVHSYLAYALIALVLLHIAAALKHFLLGRDQVMARMWPSLRVK